MQQSTMLQTQQRVTVPPEFIITETRNRSQRIALEKHISSFWCKKEPITGTNQSKSVITCAKRNGSLSTVMLYLNKWTD
jgi:hypothetical protein